MAERGVIVDSVLAKVAVARSLLGTASTSEVIDIALGGDEFLVVRPRVDAAPIALKVAQRISASLTETVNITTDIIEMRASVGVACSAEFIDADTLVAQADQAMYESKRTGSSTVAVYTNTQRS